MIATRRPIRIVFPLVLIAGGAVLLLANLGTLPEGAGWRLLQLWPLLLIMAGVQLVVMHVYHGRSADLVAVALIGLIAVLGFAYAVAGPAIGGGSYTHFTSSSPVAGVSAGTLTIDAAGSKLTVTAGDTGSDLYRAGIDYVGSAPTFSSTAGDVHVTTGRDVGFGFDQPDVIDLSVSSSIPWTVRINGAGVTVKLVFGSGLLQSFELDGVGTKADLQLGSPSGHVALTTSGVGTQMTVTVPAGADYRVSLDGLGVGVSGLRETPGWAAAADRYELYASGIGSQITMRASTG